MILTAQRCKGSSMVSLVYLVPGLRTQEGASTVPTLYFPLLTVHNYLRWLVLLALAFSLLRSYWGWLNDQPWGAVAQVSGLVSTSLLDTQLLLGLVLYGVLHFRVNTQMLTEHIIPMIFAVITAHVARYLSKKGQSDGDKYQKAALWFTVTLVIILLSIPWRRPLLR